MTLRSEYSRYTTKEERVARPLFTVVFVTSRLSLLHYVPQVDRRKWKRGEANQTQQGRYDYLKRAKIFYLLS